MPNDYTPEEDLEYVRQQSCGCNDNAELATLQYVHELDESQLEPQLYYGSNYSI